MINNPYTTFLYVATPPSTKSEAVGLAQALHGLTKLTSVSLCNCFDVEGPAVVSLAAQLPLLAHLNLQYCELFDADLQKLVQVPAPSAPPTMTFCRT